MKCVVTGACGTVGLELVRQLLNTGCDVVGLDINESALYEAQIDYPEAKFLFADIKNQAELNRYFYQTNWVFHTAALKHVDICEKHPLAALETNVRGTKNVVDAAIQQGVSSLVFTSTDKAVNPSNVMGMTKYMAERIVLQAASQWPSKRFVCARFGNVLGSHGSVIPLFTRQIKAGGPVTITDEKMTRYIMTVQQAVKMLIEQAAHGWNGSTHTLDMKAVNVVDLMFALCAHLQMPIPAWKIIGPRPGEKLYEELGEGRRSDQEKLLTVEEIQSLLKDAL